MPTPRHPARSWFQRTNPRKVRRQPHRPAAIAAQPRSRHASRNRRRFPAARTTRRPRQIPRMIRPPMQQVIRLVGHQKLRAVRRPQDQSTRFAQPRHHRRILARLVATQGQTTNLTKIPSRRDGGLHRHRQSMQSTQRRPTSIERKSPRPHPLRIEVHQRIQHWIQPRNLRNMRLS